MCPPVFGQGDILNQDSTHRSIYEPAVYDSIQFLDTLTSTFVVRDIIFSGNKKTRNVIIMRELPFETGDSIHIKDVPGSFEEGQNRLMNTGLFHEVKFSVTRFENPFVDIQVTVKERQYIWPFPYLKPVDRNLSQWLFKESGNFSRVDYGVKLLWGNFTGNNDKLRFYFVTGYTRQLMLSYRRPYIDKKLKWGVNLDVSIGKNHEIQYNTIHNKQEFLRLKDKNFARNFFKTNIEAVHRPAFFTWHTFGIGYTNLLINDSVLKLNPRFFGRPVQRVSYPEAYYRIAYRNLDYNAYPTKGHAGEAQLSKIGWSRDVNVWKLSAKGIRYWPIDDKMFYSVGASGMLKLPFDQPFYNSPLLGYDDMFLRGYEYYVMDGVAGGVINTTLARQIANFKLNIPGTRWFAPRLIPLKIYAKVYGDMGYAYQEKPIANHLNNKMLFSGGFGLDVVTMYDFTLKIEFSFNQLGQNGIYLQKKSIFQ